MVADLLVDFEKFRADLNEEILECGRLCIKRFFALDHQRRASVRMCEIEALKP